jgi:hypothetical protein
MLDDAIREHLELKRLRGADPGEVARAENEALGPVLREGHSHPDDEPLGDEPSSEVAVETGEPMFEGPDPPDPGTERPRHSAGQETVEIDMEQALTCEPAAPESQPEPPPSGLAAPVGHPAHTQASSDDSLEWEMPGDRTTGGEASVEEAEDEEPVEDVLEETPDFLRETPEQERLWFEQRPPRDFDFNE